MKNRKVINYDLFVEEVKALQNAYSNLGITIRELDLVLAYAKIHSFTIKEKK